MTKKQKKEVLSLLTDANEACRMHHMALGVASRSTKKGIYDEVVPDILEGLCITSNKIEEAISILKK